MRADGRLELNIRGIVEADDGARIALSAGGVGVFRAGEPVIDLAENITLHTAFEAYLR